MQCQIRWDEKAREFLRGIKEEDAKRIIKKVNEASFFPEHYLEPLVAIKAYKMRVGDYRIIMDFDKKSGLLSVLLIGHRKNIYDEL